MYVIPPPSDDTKFDYIVGGEEKEIHVAKILSFYYSFPDRPQDVVVSLSFEHDLALEIHLRRSHDTIHVYEKSSEELNGGLIKKVREVCHELMTQEISKFGPDEWSEYMFGNIKLWTPNGLDGLMDYIIHLNDKTSMSREEIAQHVEDLMGASMPRIPMNPLSWILEDRPVNIDYSYSDDGAIVSPKIKASELTYGGDKPTFILDTADLTDFPLF